LNVFIKIKVLWSSSFTLLSCPVYDWKFSNYFMKCKDQNADVWFLKMSILHEWTRVVFQVRSGILTTSRYINIQLCKRISILHIMCTSWDAKRLHDTFMNIPKFKQRRARNANKFCWTRQWNLPVNLATPLKLMSSIITGSERPFAFTANRISRYDVVASRLSSTKDTGGLCTCEWRNVD